MTRRTRKAQLGLVAAVVALLVSSGSTSTTTQQRPQRANRPTIAQLLDRLEAQTLAIERGTDLTRASEEMTRRLAALFERIDRASRKLAVHSHERAERVAAELRANPLLPGGSIYETIDHVYAGLERDLAAATQTHLHALERVQRWTQIAAHAEPELAVRARERIAVWQGAVDDTMAEVVEYESALADTQYARAFFA